MASVNSGLHWATTTKPEHDHQPTGRAPATSPGDRVCGTPALRWARARVAHARIQLARIQLARQGKVRPSLLSARIGGSAQPAQGPASTYPDRRRSWGTRWWLPEPISPWSPAAPAPTWMCSGRAVRAGLGERQCSILTTGDPGDLAAPQEGWSRHPKGLLSTQRAAAPLPTVARKHHPHPRFGAHPRPVATGLQAAAWSWAGC
mmetsp:Transcript_25942/g.62676  ORF Transcript_25942/g.62676 Transcript_25942/m.62676 type:complete len:204 (+) Transcript_25942:315-926(+)